MKCCHAVGRGIRSLGEFWRRAANKVHVGDMGDAGRILAVERKATRQTFRDEVFGYETRFLWQKRQTLTETETIQNI